MRPRTRARLRAPGRRRWRPGAAERRAGAAGHAARRRRRAFPPRRRRPPSAPRRKPPSTTRGAPRSSPPPSGSAAPWFPSASRSRQDVRPQLALGLFFVPEGIAGACRATAPASSSGPTAIILTNQHVVARAEQVVVTLPDGSDLPAKVLGEDPLTDIAVLKVDRHGPARRRHRPQHRPHDRRVGRGAGQSLRLHAGQRRADGDGRRGERHGPQHPARAAIRRASTST